MIHETFLMLIKDKIETKNLWEEYLLFNDLNSVYTAKISYTYSRKSLFTKSKADRALTPSFANIMCRLQSFWCTCLTLYDLPKVSYGIFVSFRDGGSWGVWRKVALASYASDFENGNSFAGYWDYSAKKLVAIFFTDSSTCRLICPLYKENCCTS